ncbi:PREDICTED: uncharacterized protein LOC105456152 [Wasmannia auropunctata]|uniref:uncharacterized protein LOC105456152 n=1 Tax=Wasmannia auropunctata TaxID=64793 RepID=UPI0005EF0647|nr:PREDICTED: uncharacterized protein LOC105456152 [Wasmannia auropunctata]
MLETWMEKKGWEKMRERLPKEYRWEVQWAERRNRKGRAKGGMMMGIRKGIRVVGDRKENGEGIMMRTVEIGREEWRIVGVYVNGNMESKWEEIRGWAEEKGVRTIMGGDFNARTGELGGWWEGGDVRREEDERKSRDKRVNREGRILIEKLEEVGWFIFNGCGKGDEEGMWTYSGGWGESVIDYVVGNEEVWERIVRMEVQDRVESDHMPVVVVAALHPVERNAERESSYPHYATVLEFAGIEFPMTLKDITKFERANDVSINVYCIEKEGGELSDPSSIGHFAWIKNLFRLVSSQLSKKQHKNFFCDRCLHYFSSQERLDAHTVDCNELNECAVELPKEDPKWLTFGKHGNKDIIPFVLYADLECVLEKMDPNLPESQHHKVHSIGYYVHCSYDDALSMYRCRRDKDCVAWFVEEFKELAHKVKSAPSVNVPMAELTRDECERYNNATHCRTCEKPFAAEDTQVRDHCHMTGRYRGPAHSNCNLNYKNLRCIPVVFHNLFGYDAHFIIKEVAIAYEGYVNLLPVTKENSNLEKLASYLEKDKLRIMQRDFCTLPVKHFELLTRKGVFPYEYVDHFEKLEDTRLPPRVSFHSSLTGDTVSESDYEHAVDVWQRFSIGTLGEYSDLYLKTDVLLLADVFENFRDSCVASYGLDPAHYFTLPGFTWDAMLKHMRVNFELLTDIDMVLFIERGIRDGFSQCSNRYARANNKYMSAYDPSKPSSYLIYYDVNNSYG